MGHLRDRSGRGKTLVDREDVANVGVAGILPRLAGRIGRRRPELLPDRLRRIEQADRVAQALRHLGFAVEPQHALRRGQERLRLGEVALAVAGVPTARDLAHQLEMLNLILSHWHETGLVQEDVGRLKDRVREQARGHALLALGLVLELGLALELAERGDRGEQPVELGVFGHVGLDEHDRLIGVEPHRATV